MEANIINFIRIIKKLYIYINIQCMKYVFSEKDYQSDNGMITYIWGHYGIFYILCLLIIL